MGLFSSEGGQFIGGHAMSDDAKRRSAAALNAMWDEGKLERIRASEEAVILPGRRLSVLLQTQPEVGHVFLSDAVLRDIGLLSRFLITEPETTMGSRPHRDLTSAHEAAMAAYRAKTLGLLRQPLPYDDRGEALKPLPLEMTTRGAGTMDRILGRGGRGAETRLQAARDLRLCQQDRRARSADRGGAGGLR